MKQIILFCLFLLFLLTTQSARATPVNIYCEGFKGYTYYFDDSKNGDKEFIKDKSEGLKLSLYIDDHNKSLISYTSVMNKQVRNNEMDGDKLQVSIYKTIPGFMRIEVLEFPGEKSVNKLPAVNQFYVFNVHGDSKAEVIQTTYRLNSSLPKVSIQKADCMVGAVTLK